MDTIEIKRFLLDSNPHWSTGSVDLPPGLAILYRPQFELLKDRLGKPQILALIGMRRVGKTVIMRQLMHLLCKEHPARNVCRMSFDEEMVGKTPDILDRMIRAATSDALRGKRIFLFIDEIQFVKNWQHILKRYYDSREEIKFIVSGSSSLFIQKRTTESLAGRIFEFRVPPLAYWEYLLLADRHVDSAGRLSKLKIDFEGLDPASAGVAIEEIQIRDATLSDGFDEYLCCRQFPEAAAWPEGLAYEYIRNSIYKKTLLYDIPRIFEIRRPDELAFLYNILMRESANLLEINNLARDAGINRNTVSAYLGYLKEALLHIQISNATSSIREQRRLLRKGYVPSPNFGATLLKLSWTHPLWPRESGHAAETFVANSLWERYEDSLHFYRKGDSEVDFLVTPVPGRTRGSLLIEVKYSGQAQSRELKALSNLAEAIDARLAVCITRDRFMIERTGRREIVFIPIWAL